MMTTIDKDRHTYIAQSLLALLMLVATMLSAQTEATSNFVAKYSTAESATMAVTDPIVINSCENGTGDLTSHVASTQPSNLTITYHTGSPATDSNRISLQQAQNAPVGTYFVAFYSENYGGCYSPTSSPLYVPKCLQNACPEETVDLTNIADTSTNAGSGSLEWHTSPLPDRTSLVTNSQAVGTGVYWAVYYDEINDCYSPVSNAVAVNIEDCTPCTLPGATGSTNLPAYTGITTLKRGTDSTWVNTVNNSFLVLESTEKGFVPTRLTTSQRDAIGANTLEGMMIFNTTTQCLEFYDGTRWVCSERCN
ncbi:MAG: hypothetical protein Q4F57_06620 [Weeksellaceae bacterium]|nr:hypothetical protein [Weeksellaceae bacterium]